MIKVGNTERQHRDDGGRGQRTRGGNGGQQRVRYEKTLMGRLLKRHGRHLRGYIWERGSIGVDS